MSAIAAAGTAGSLLVNFGIALALTIAVEVLVAVLFGLRTRYALAIVALMNVVTNPPLNLILTLVMWLTRGASLADPPVLVTLVVLEVIVVIAEWRLLAWALPEERTRAFVVSLAMNASSLVVGLAARALLA